VIDGEQVFGTPARVAIAELADFLEEPCEEFSVCRFLHGSHHPVPDPLCLSGSGAQQLREAFPWDSAPRFLLRDRDWIFGHGFVEQSQAMGIEQVLSAPGADKLDIDGCTRHRLPGKRAVVTNRACTSAILIRIGGLPRTVQPLTALARDTCPRVESSWRLISARRSI
jgi:hypothetical protein